MRVCVLFLAAMLAGCMTVDIPTDPQAFSLEANRLSQLPRSQAVALKNGYTGDATLRLKMSSNTWVIDQKQLTETALAMLGRAMQQQGLTLDPQAGKTVTLRARVLSTRFRTMPFVAMISVRLALNASFGDGSGTYIEADNSSPGGAQRAYDGAVLFALNQLVADPKFTAYLNR